MLKPVPRKSPSCMVSRIEQGMVSWYLKEEWWPGSESNQRHADFQSAALPTELPGRGAAHYKEAPRVCTNRPGLAGTSKKQNPGAATGLSRYRLLAGGDVIRRGCGALTEEEFFHLTFDQLARLG